MNISQAIHYIHAQAMTPDQLLPYVSAVSGAQSELLDDYVIHKQEGHAVLVGYSLQNPLDTDLLNTCIERVIQQPDVQSITVLAPARPSIAPENAISGAKDAYWFVDVPMPRPTVKVRNMLKRAQREIYITKTNGKHAWTGAHHEMMLAYMRNKGMDAALCSILQRLGTYLITSPQTMLFSAYSKETQELQACALSDFSSFSTAFYMFAFKREDAIPGVADAVLFSLLEEAESCGHSQCNLGLGINEGIRFFKQKWGAKPTLPYIQTTWKLEKSIKSWFSRFLD